MKYLASIIILLFTLLIISCSNNNSGITSPAGTNPFGGGNNNSNVTFQVSIQQDQQHGIYFHFIPSVDVKIIKVDGTINGQTLTISGDANTTFTVAEGFSVTVNNATAGEQWSFKIIGKIASNNQDFTSTVNYTVPQGFGGNTGTVTFEIKSQPGQENSTDFLFKPNVDVKITKVDVEMGGATDVVTGDGTTVYSGNNWYVLAGYGGVASGQQWKFTFNGKLAANSQDYAVTVTYTIP